jgi:hypothetical protein
LLPGINVAQRAVEGMGPEVRRFVDRDADVWRGVAATERFKRLFPQDSSATPGR